VDDYVQRGLLSLIEKPLEPIDGGLILYADRQFMEPPGDRWRLETSTLGWDEKLGAWVIYEERSRALGRLARWGRALIKDAQQRLRAAAKLPIESAGADVERALDDGRRARFCAPPPENRDVREDAFACWAGAWLLQGRPIDALLRDARRDFPDDPTIDRIEATARDLAKPHAPIYSPRKGNPKLSWAPHAT